MEDPSDQLEELTAVMGTLQISAGSLPQAHYNGEGGPFRLSQAGITLWDGRNQQRVHSAWDGKRDMEIWRVPLRGDGRPSTWHAPWDGKWYGDL